MTNPERISDELSPCPFCGLAEHLSLRAEGAYTPDMPARPYRVVCNHIDHDTVEGPIGYGRNGAITAWNRRSPPAQEGMVLDVDELAGEIRYVDPEHKLGAGALAEALMPFLRAALAPAPDAVKPGDET